MPSSIPFESFLHERSCGIPLKEVDSTATMTWFLEGDLKPTIQARTILDQLFAQPEEIGSYRESSEKSLLPLKPGLEIRGFLKEDFCWQYADEQPSVERLQRILFSRRLRLINPLEMMQVLWSQPWAHRLFHGKPHFFFMVAMQEMEGMDEALIFRFRSGEPIRPLAFDVSWDDFCCMRELQPQTILYTKM